MPKSYQTMLTIGQAAKLTRLSAKAIRLYETKGLLQSGKRTDAGYRLFSRRDVAVLGFIRQAKTLGLELQEIKNILELQRGGEQPCQRVIGLVDKRIEEIDQKITDLQQLRTSLSTVRKAARNNQCHGQPVVVCRIIEAVESQLA